MSHRYNSSPGAGAPPGGRRGWLLRLAQALALAPVLAAAPAPPDPLPAATLTVVDGHRHTRDRALLLPGRVVGGLRFSLPALGVLAPGAAPALVGALFARSGAPGGEAPPRLGEASVLFATGSGAYRLRGAFRESELEHFWVSRGCEWTPRDDGGGYFDSLETWGVAMPGLVVGSWGPRPRRAWVGELDGRGRRIERLAEVRPGEILRAWARAESTWGKGDVPLADLAPLVPGPRPVALERAGVRWRRHQKGVRQCLQLTPRWGRDLEALGEWVRMLWDGPAEARVRRRGQRLEACWVEPGPVAAARLERWVPQVVGWISGDPYRAVQ